MREYAFEHQLANEIHDSTNGASCKQANQLTKKLVFSEFSPIEYSSVYVDVVEHIGTTRENERGNCI